MYNAALSVLGFFLFFAVVLLVAFLFVTVPWLMIGLIVGGALLIVVARFVYDMIEPLLLALLSMLKSVFSVIGAVYGRIPERVRGFIYRCIPLFLIVVFMTAIINLT